MSALRALLAGIVDYAGLFPPAGLDMPDAVRNYARYRATDDAWMLGRFVVPATRLAEFHAAHAAHAALARDDAAGARAAPGPWLLTVTVGASLEREMAAVRAFNEREGERILIDSVEGRADTPAAVERFAELTAGFAAFAELPSEPDPTVLVGAVSACGICAKIRTGGTTVDAFPSADAVARFIRACVAATVPFKATAGLHHPLRGTFRVTYDAAAPAAMMFGYLNVFLAATLATQCPEPAVLTALLAESRMDALSVTPDAIVWRGHRLATDALAHARRHVARSFGSCSFREPVDELRALVPGAGA